MLRGTSTHRAVQALMAALTGRRDQLRKDLSHMLNPHFGSIFRSSHYPTILALSVMRCVSLDRGAHAAG